MKNIVIFSPNPDAYWLPTLWMQAKTYYIKNGRDHNQWRWYPCYADFWQDDLDRVKAILFDAQPDVFCMSLYVWNAREQHEIARWVRQHFPNCVILSGGPHQHFKHDMDWFKKHPYIDASLPGDHYGEITIAEVLDNYDNIDWSRITGVLYPSSSRTIKYSKQHLSKRSYDYAWPQYAQRQSDIQDLFTYRQQHRPRRAVSVILETTRGCPYSCTFCDWGGGIGDKLIRRDIKYVQQDIDTLARFNVATIYLSDANWGIFGDRDVKIMQYLGETKKQNNSRFQVFYGGLAKTKNRLPYIEKILDITQKYDLEYNSAFKFSLQSINDAVLKNINRTNIPYSDLLQVYRRLKDRYQLSGYIEFIVGLPGSNLDIMLDEIQCCWEDGFFGEWYEWILLPEAPAYDREYREKFELMTVKKTAWWSQTRDVEVVVGTSSYTSQDYLYMLLAQSFFNLFYQTGVFKNSLREITRGCEFKEFIRDLLFDFLPQQAYYAELHLEWDRILREPEKACYFDLLGGSYIGKHLWTNLMFYRSNHIAPQLAQWISDRYGVKDSVTARDLEQIITIERWGLSRYHNSCLPRGTDIVKRFEAEVMSNYQTRDLLTARPKYLGWF